MQKGLAYGVWLLMSCQGAAVDIGSDRPEVIGDGGSNGGYEGWPSTAVCQSGTQLPIVGTWEGYTEMRSYTSRSDAVRLVITGANDIAVCGTITFGTATPPPPPMDPNHGGPGIDPLGNRISEELEGLDLTLLKGKATLPRLTFQATTDEFWKPWCELQTPYASETSPGLWLCIPTKRDQSTTPLPDGGCEYRPMGTPTGAGEPVDCAKVALCRSEFPCQCTAAGCSVRSDNGEIRFDVTVIGNEIHGTGFGSTVHLAKIR